jgi:hypothetical protein
MKTIAIFYILKLFACLFTVLKSSKLNNQSISNSSSSSSTGDTHETTANKKYQNTSLSLLYNLTSGVFYAEEVTLSSERVHKLVGVPYARVHSAFGRPIPLEPISDSKSADSSRLLQLNNSWPPVCLQAVMFNHNFYGAHHLFHLKLFLFLTTFIYKLLTFIF